MSTYLYFPNGRGLKKVGEGRTAWDALKDALGKEKANSVAGDCEDLQWEMREQDGFYDEVADHVFKDTGLIIGRFERY